MSKPRRPRYEDRRNPKVPAVSNRGREVLREWLATPVSPFAMDFEAMIRLFAAPLGTKEQIVTTLNQVRDEAREMLRFGGEMKQEFLEGIAVTQDQVYIRALAVDFFISLLNTVEAWAERTLAEIESWDDLSPDGKNERAQTVNLSPVTGMNTLLLIGYVDLTALGQGGTECDQSDSCSTI